MSIFPIFRLATPHAASPGRRIGALLALTLGLATFSMASLASDHERRSSRVPANPRYQAECSACHVAYSPTMLPAASWQRIMKGLDRHYGTDASLDADSVQALTTWLATNGGRGAEPPEDRITRTRWFIHEHDEIGDAVWKRTSVRSPAQCAACHTQAAQGVFSEHDVRIPR